MNEQTVINPAQTEVDRLWAKIDELITIHGRETELLFSKLDNSHRENQALRREIEQIKAEPLALGWQTASIMADDSRNVIVTFETNPLARKFVHELKQ